MGIELYFHLVTIVSGVTGIKATRVALEGPNGLGQFKAYLIGFFGGTIILTAGLLLCPLALFLK